MNDNHKHEQDEREAADAAGGETMSDEALVTAYALGELEGAEHAAQRARIEALAAREAGVRAEIERIRDVGDDLRREFFLESRMAAPALSAEQRRAIERELAGAAASDEAAGGEPAGFAGPEPAPRLRRLPMWMAAAASLVGVALIVWALRPGEHASTSGPNAPGPVAMNERDELPAQVQEGRGLNGIGKDTEAAEAPAAGPAGADGGNAAADKLAQQRKISEPDGTVIFTNEPTQWMRADEYIARAGGESDSAAPAAASGARSHGAQYKGPPDAGAAETLQAMGYINTAPPTNPAGANAPAPGSSHLTARKARTEGLAAAAPVAPNEPVVAREIAPDDGRDDRRFPEPCIYWRVQPAPGTEYYAPIVEQGFASPIHEPLSTFSIDVDTASYANVRRFLNNGQLPPADAVRIEELINYFEYDYPSPDSETPFATHVAVTECPWASQHRLVRIGIKGREVPAAERAASNLVFLLDVSGSMNEPDKLPLLVASMKLLVGQLDGRDRVAIVTYAGNAGLRLESTVCDPAGRAKILGVLDGLSAGGSTAGAAGIQLAYQIAAAQLVAGGTNRVILATDGDFNVGITDRDALQKLIEDAAKSGVFLSVLGFGEGNLKDGTAELLADKGNGNYSYIDSLDEGRRVLVHEMGGTLVVIAKDVKIQVEFNPAKVGAYRLIGYENRALAAQDFNDDRKDAGEIGAGHTVTALYEVVPVGVAVVPGVDPLKYQVPADLPQPQLTDSPDLLTLSLRWKKPDADSSSKLSMPVVDQGGTLAQAGPDARFAAAVAAFGMLLRGSTSAGDASWDSVLTLAEAGRGADQDGYRAEFIRLVQVAKGLSVR
jgi:Ca-activated chloride channel family protein